MTNNQSPKKNPCTIVILKKLQLSWINTHILKKPYKIGLTGGIGSGKSTIAQIFKSIEIPIFNSDTCGKELLSNDQDTIRNIIHTFGHHIEKNNLIEQIKNWEY